MATVSSIKPDLKKKYVFQQTLSQTKVTLNSFSDTNTMFLEILVSHQKHLVLVYFNSSRTVR
jgi:hypothetical protein